MSTPGHSPSPAYYSQENIDILTEGWRAAQAQFGEINFAVLGHAFNDARAQEYATQGLLRRVLIMARCIDIVFDILPPGRTELPTRNELSDAMINIQAFVFNLFGGLDNLAWIWLFETGLKQESGSDIPSRWVGLGPGNKFIRRSLPSPLQDELSGFGEWFKHVESYRHALAHRISLYIPPFILAPENEERYREIEDQKALAIRRRDRDDYDRLDAQQEALGVFRPWILHSYNESARIDFHSQLLTDFKTLAHIAAAIIAELDSRASSAGEPHGLDG